jgi:hypothetical protein
MDRDEHVGGGGMTGATGDLTPDETDQAFDPGERREVEDPVHRADMTQAQARGAPAQQGEVGQPEHLPTGDPTNMATRDAGYGSQHGLRPDDPAYRMEVHPSPTPPTERQLSDRTRIGGDEVSEGEEHF